MRRVRRLLHPLCTRRYSSSSGIVPALDIRHIRDHPGLYRQNCVKRNYQSLFENINLIEKLSQELRRIRIQVQPLYHEAKRVQSKLGSWSGQDGKHEAAAGVDMERLIEQAKRVKTALNDLKAREAEAAAQINELAWELPNLTSEHTPIGDEPKVLGFLNSDRSQALESLCRSHVDIGDELDIVDFATASRTSGRGFYYLKSEAALLEQALVSYGIKVARRRGFELVSPPSLVHSDIVAACGYRPRDRGGEQQIYTINQGQQDSNSTVAHSELSLAGTSEIPLAALKAQTTMRSNELPLRLSALSRCYRAEAGSYGADAKGLYRVHEFSKVEMFAWTLPDLSAATAIFDEMVDVQKEVLSALGLRCRVLEQPSTDLGASAFRKIDIEAIFPSRRDRNEGWGEVTSTSICTDYQTRRLQTRLRSLDMKDQKQKNNSAGAAAFPFTINGTAMAVPRVLAAILETHWDEGERCIRVPPVLWPWMSGIEVIRKSKRPA